MAEIKSTLDIIMEKARDINVSEEEKKAFQRNEFEGKARGLLQKLLDGLLDLAPILFTCWQRHPATRHALRSPRRSPA